MKFDPGILCCFFTNTIEKKKKKKKRQFWSSQLEKHYPHFDRGSNPLSPFQHAQGLCEVEGT